MNKLEEAQHQLSSMVRLMKIDKLLAILLQLILDAIKEVHDARK